MDETAQPFLPLVAVFGDPEIGRLLSERAHVERWLEVERALAAAQAELGLIPAEAAAAIAAHATAERIDLALLREGMRTVGYPILPLLEQVNAASPPEVARFIHWGATTQDIMDTGLALTLAAALDRIQELAVALGDAIARRAGEHRATVMTGRTHAQPAVPVTFGGKLAVWLAELGRHLDRLRAVRSRVAAVSLFGAAGTAAALGPRSGELRRLVAARLGLEHTDVPWHTARDSLTELGFCLAAAAATCGKIGREVIALSRPELGEVRERGGHHRGASSTMPQKANPIGSETVVGMSILAAQHVPALLAAMQAGHERSAGEWQVEWDALPSLAALSAGALAGAAEVVAGLEVFPERMRENLERDGGLVMAEAAMMALAPAIGRAQAHDVVYAASARARAEGVTLAEALGEAAVAPEDYVGESEAIVSSALRAWAAGRARR